MSKPKLFVQAAAMALLSLLFTSCQKAIDYIEQHPNAYVPPCRVTSFKVNVSGTPANYVVSYDAKGNPISMLDSEGYYPVGIDQYFRYDKQGRVSDYMQTYAPSLYPVAWHKYVYARPDYVIDTAMYYETGYVYGPSPIAKNTFEYYIKAYSLDRLDRIVKVWSIPIDPPNTPSLESTLVYDANGNLTPPSPQLSYDNKVNIYRTSKTWQFVYKDYSRNNLQRPAGGFLPQYNVFGLPLQLDNLEPLNYWPFLEPNSGPNAIVEYACDMPKGPVVY